MANKRIKPEDFVQTSDVEKQGQQEDKGVSPETLAALVQQQSRIIEKLEEKLETMSKPVVSQQEAVSRQEELKRIEMASKTQKQLLVEKLNRQVKRSIMIPLGINEKPGATHEVGINGVVFVYPKGQMIEVPDTVFRLIADHFNITSAAGQDMRIDRDDNVVKALE